VYRSVLQCVAVCCSVVQCVAVCKRSTSWVFGTCRPSRCTGRVGSVLLCVAMCCSVLQCAAACCSLLQRVKGSWSSAPVGPSRWTGRVDNVLQYGAVYYSVLQCVAVYLVGPQHPWSKSLYWSCLLYFVAGAWDRGAMRAPPRPHSQRIQYSTMPSHPRPPSLLALAESVVPRSPTCGWVMSHTWMSHGTRVNQPWHIHPAVAESGVARSPTYAWVMSRVMYIYICDICIRNICPLVIFTYIRNMYVYILTQDVGIQIFAICMYTYIRNMYVYILTQYVCIQISPYTCIYHKCIHIYAICMYTDSGNTHVNMTGVYIFTHIHIYAICMCISRVGTSRHTIEWVTTHNWMSHDTRLNEWWHTIQWVMTHTWMSHDTLLNESWHTIEWMMAHYSMHNDTK